MALGLGDTFEPPQAEHAGREPARAAGIAALLRHQTTAETLLELFDQEREAALKSECEQLRSENATLRAKFGVELAGEPPKAPVPEGAADGGAGEGPPPDAKKAKTGD